MSNPKSSGLLIFPPEKIGKKSVRIGPDPSTVNIWPPYKCPLRWISPYSKSALPFTIGKKGQYICPLWIYTERIDIRQRKTGVVVSRHDGEEKRERERDAIDGHSWTAMMATIQLHRSVVIRSPQSTIAKKKREKKLVYVFCDAALSTFCGFNSMLRFIRFFFGYLFLRPHPIQSAPTDGSNSTRKYDRIADVRALQTYREVQHKHETNVVIFS